MSFNDFSAHHFRVKIAFNDGFEDGLSGVVAKVTETTGGPAGPGDAVVSQVVAVAAMAESR